MELYEVDIAINDNYYNDDNMLHASVWLEFFGGLLWTAKRVKYGREAW